MKKVRTIFLLRRIAAPFVFLLGAAITVVSTVSISNVISNMPSDISAATRFFAAAFAHTDVVVKGALVAGLVLLVLTLKRLIESAKLTSSFEKA